MYMTQGGVWFPRGKGEDEWFKWKDLAGVKWAIVGE